MNKIVVLKTASETVENTKFLYQLSQNYPSPCGKAGGVCLPGSTIYIDINSLAFQPRLGVWHPICTKACARRFWCIGPRVRRTWRQRAPARIKSLLRRKFKGTQFNHAKACWSGAPKTLPQKFGGSFIMNTRFLVSLPLAAVL